MFLCFVSGIFLWKKNSRNKSRNPLEFIIIGSARKKSKKGSVGPKFIEIKTSQSFFFENLKWGDFSRLILTDFRSRGSTEEFLMGGLKCTCYATSTDFLFEIWRLKSLLRFWIIRKITHSYQCFCMKSLSNNYYIEIHFFLFKI